MSTLTSKAPAVGLPGGYTVVSEVAIACTEAFMAKIQYNELKSPVPVVTEVPIAGIGVQLVKHPSDDGALCKSVAEQLLAVYRLPKTQENMEKAKALQSQLLVTDINIIGFENQGTQEAPEYVPVFRAYVNYRGASEDAANIAITGGIGLPIEEYTTKTPDGKERKGRGVSTEKSFLNNLNNQIYAAMAQGDETAIALLEIWGGMRFMETRAAKGLTVSATDQASASTKAEDGNPFAGMDTASVEDLPVAPLVGAAVTD